MTQYENDLTKKLDLIERLYGQRDDLQLRIKNLRKELLDHMTSTGKKTFQDQNVPRVKITRQQRYKYPMEKIISLKTMLDADTFSELLKTSVSVNVAQVRKVHQYNGMESVKIFLDSCVQVSDYIKINRSKDHTDPNLNDDANKHVSVVEANEYVTNMSPTYY